MSRSYYSVPVTHHTPKRATKRYWKNHANRCFRRSLSRSEYDESQLRKSNDYRRHGDLWYHDINDKGYLEKEYYDTFADGDYYKLIRK